MKKYIFILLVACACEEELSPACSEHSRRCSEILRQIDAADTEKERNQLYQFYLAEKQMLDNCR